MDPTLNTGASSDDAGGTTEPAPPPPPPLRRRSSFFSSGGCASSGAGGAHEEEELAASTMELFLDLAIVSMINRIAEPLHEDVTPRRLTVYALRGFCLWFSWHRGVVATNAVASARGGEPPTPWVAHVFGPLKLGCWAAMAVSTSETVDECAQNEWCVRACACPRARVRVRACACRAIPREAVSPGLASRRLGVSPSPRRRRAPRSRQVPRRVRRDCRRLVGRADRGDRR